MREALGGLPPPLLASPLTSFSTLTPQLRQQRRLVIAVTYESGIDNVPGFDAHPAVYGKDKTVSLQYNTPYVKELARK